VQVGNQDFAIDLVFFHRGLTCLVAFELKVRKFEPEDIGKLSFYVEALDRDVRKPHERPSIGVLLCATKDDEVVEYALSRTTSPTLVAEYRRSLPGEALTSPTARGGAQTEDTRTYSGPSAESRRRDARARAWSLS
jgi:hypothetical protein